MDKPIAVVTGASTGIGAATVHTLADQGFHVVAGARRLEKVTEVCAGLDATPVALDITSDRSVAELAATVGRMTGPVRVLVNNAGGAIGVDPVEVANLDDWRAMYELNVLGTVRITQAFLPALEESGDGQVVLVSSTAGHSVYEGGAGYGAAKRAISVIREIMRMELLGRPIRISEIAPGMVHTEEFSLRRFDGDVDAAAAIYEGVPGPLSAEDVAEVIGWVVSRPSHVNVDFLMVRPRAQAGQKLHRVSESPV